MLTMAPWLRATSYCGPNSFTATAGRDDAACFCLPPLPLLRCRGAVLTSKPRLIAAAPGRAAAAPGLAAAGGLAEALDVPTPGLLVSAAGLSERVSSAGVGASGLVEEAPRAAEGALGLVEEAPGAAEGATGLVEEAPGAVSEPCRLVGD